MNLLIETNCFLDEMSGILTQDSSECNSEIIRLCKTLLLSSQSGKFCWFGKDVRLSPSQGLPQMKVFTLLQSEIDGYNLGWFAMKNAILVLYFPLFFLLFYVWISSAHVAHHPFSAILAVSFISPVFCWLSIACFLSIDPPLKDSFQLCVLTAWQYFVSEY